MAARPLSDEHQIIAASKSLERWPERIQRIWVQGTADDWDQALNTFENLRQKFLRHKPVIRRCEGQLQLAATEARTGRLASPDGGNTTCAHAAVLRIAEGFIRQFIMMATQDDRDEWLIDLAEPLELGQVTANHDDMYNMVNWYIATGLGGETERYRLLVAAERSALFASAKAEIPADEKPPAASKAVPDDMFRTIADELVLRNEMTEEDRPTSEWARICSISDDSFLNRMRPTKAGATWRIVEFGSQRYKVHVEDLPPTIRGSKKQRDDFLSSEAD